MLYQRIIILGLWLAFAACQTNTEREKPEKDILPAETPSAVKMARAEAAISAYIKEKTNQHDGSFHLQERKNDLPLKLIRVHTTYLSMVGPQHYFACVDLADTSGNVYDVDFFLQDNSGSLIVTDTTLHTRNGIPFYLWKQNKDKTWQKVAIKDASPELLGVIEGTDAFEFRYHVVLPEMKKQAKMWVPVAKTDSFQKVKVISVKGPGKQALLEEKENGNSILYLELEQKHSGQPLEIVYEVKRQEKGSFEEAEPDTEKYLGANFLMPVGGKFSEIANQTLNGKRLESKLVQARALYDYVIEQMRYIKTGDYGRGDAVYACDTRTGNCTEFHSYFISLARSAGIPARFSIGASIPSTRNDGGIEGYHCWAEFYAEGKWWPVDISEGNKYPSLASYYFGHHPANRIELSRGRDLRITPGPASGPISFLVHPVLEVGGEPIKIQATFSFSRKSDVGRLL